MTCNAGFIIILAIIIFPTTIIITYPISLHHRHIIPIWPYISDTGNDPFESCFFSLGVNIVAGLYALIIFLRYVQIFEHIKIYQKKLLTQLNASSLAWGMISSLTLSATACFQKRNTGFIHLLFATVCSYSALIYLWHQTIFSFICYGWISKPNTRFRLILCISSTVIHLFAPFLFLYTVINNTLPEGSVTEWAYNPEALTIYVTGAFLEWFVFIFNLLFIASMYKEFKGIKLTTGEIVIHEND